MPRDPARCGRRRRARAAAQVLGGVDVLAHRTGAATRRARPHRPRGGRAPEPAPNRGREARRGRPRCRASSRCPRRRRRTAAACGALAPRTVGELVGAQRGQVGAQRDRPQRRARGARARRRPGRSEALRSPVCPSGIASTPRSREPARQRDVVGDDQDPADRGAVEHGVHGVDDEGDHQARGVPRRRAARAVTWPRASGLTGTTTPNDASAAGSAERGGSDIEPILPAPPAPGVAVRTVVRAGRRLASIRRTRSVGGAVAKPRSMRERRGWAFSIAVGILKPLLLAFTRHHWIDGEQAPGRRRRGRRRQPRLAPRPADVRALHLRPRSAAALPRQGRAVRRVLRRLDPHGHRADPGPPDDARRVPRLLRRRSRRCRRGRSVVVYPEGTLTREPDLWPMVGKTGAARIALTAGVPGRPGRAVGRARDPLPLREAARPRCPRKPIHVKVGDPVDLDDLRGQDDHPRGAARGDRPDHGRHHRRCSRTSAARRRRPSASTRGSAGVQLDRQPPRASRRKKRPQEEADEQGRGVRCRVVGHGVLARAGRRRPRGHALGAPRGPVRRDQRRRTRTPTTSPASSCPTASARRTTPARPPRERRARRARGAVADAARQPRGLGRGAAVRRRAAVADEGRRARHPASG